MSVACTFEADLLVVLIETERWSSLLLGQELNLKVGAQKFLSNAIHAAFLQTTLKLFIMFILIKSNDKIYKFNKCHWDIKYQLLNSSSCRTIFVNIIFKRIVHMNLKIVVRIILFTNIFNIRLLTRKSAGNEEDERYQLWDETRHAHEHGEIVVFIEKTWPMTRFI